MPRDYRSAHSETTAPPIPCPGWHNDAWRYDETDDPEHEQRAIPGDPIWCEGCTTRIRSTLAFLPHLAAALELEIEEATDQAPERVSGTRQRAIHEHQAQALLLDEIRDVLTQWEDETREQRAFTPRKQGVRQAAALAAAAAFLGAQLEWILTKAPGAHDAQGLTRAFVDRIHKLDRRGMRLTHQDEPKAAPCIGVPCRSCDYKALVRDVDRLGTDTGEVKCENCRAKMTMEEYRPLAAQWAAYEHARLPDQRRLELAAPIAVYERARGAA
jgi:hypothetical protein